ncbi:MAG: hypothetical protein C0625_04210 [Arcobacter sp.]|nr:MAG: hypothetical protein C0625_04210 [Arcobacter sp.]
MFKLLLTSSILVFYLTACIGTSRSYSPPTKIDKEDVKESALPLSKRADYNKLLNEKDKTKKYIDDLEAQKYEAHQNIMNIGSGMNASRGSIAGAVSSYASPENNIKHNRQIYDVTAVELTIQRKKLSKIYDDLATIANESKKSCFPKDVKVLVSENEYKDISDINIGDNVLVYDIGNDKISNSIVKEKFIDVNNHYYKLNDSIEATAFERFLTKDGWKIVREIKKGDYLFNGNSYEKIVSIEKIVKDLDVYNLHIDSSHNFFVSKDGENFLLIHNTGGGSGGGGGK